MVRVFELAFGTGFPNRNLTLSVLVFRTGFCFCWDGFLTDALPLAPASLAKLNCARVFVGTSRAGILRSFLIGLDPPPIMRRRLSTAVTVMGEGQEEIIGRAVFSVAAAPAFGDVDETEGFGFADSRGNRCAMDAIGDKIIGSDRQASVVIAAVMRKLDFDAAITRCADRERAR